MNTSRTTIIAFDGIPLDPADRAALVAHRVAARRRYRRIRAVVRLVFWSLFALVVWIGVSSIEDLRPGWWLMYAAAVVLLVATAVVVHLQSREPR